MLVQVVIATANDDVARRLGECLEHPGYLVERVAADERAIRSVRSLSPDLVILDDDLFDVLDRKPGARTGTLEPDFLVVADRIESERHAELLAKGCLGAVGWTVGSPEFEDAVWAVVSRWRRDAEEALAAAWRGPEELALGDFVTSSASMRKFMKV
ncbi:MAG: hypothetical protein KDB80_13210, partial [Planctomycetes bacterium]|nr:hypothetical protein [Planctomycetota bacterium]